MKNIYYLMSFKCNQYCSKCRHWQKLQTEDVLDDLLIVNTLWSLTPVEEFCIVGGEPLLHSDVILKILSDTKKLTHRTVIVTNGVLLTPEMVDELSQYRIHLVVSVDTMDRNFWRYVRGDDSYARVMDNLEYACRVLSSEQLSIQSVVAKETLPYLKEVSAFCHDRGLFHSLQDYVQDGFEGEWTAVDANKFHSQKKSISACYAAGRNLSIDPQGNVNTCFQQALIPGCEKPLGI